MTVIWVSLSSVEYQMFIDQVSEKDWRLANIVGNGVAHSLLRKALIIVKTQLGIILLTQRERTFEWQQPLDIKSATLQGNHFGKYDKIARE